MNAHRPLIPRRLVLGTGLLLAGCVGQAPPPSQDSSSTQGDEEGTSPSPTSLDSATSIDDASGSATSTSSGEPPLDGTTTTGPDPTATGSSSDSGPTTGDGSSSSGEPDVTCNAIDFLFVVDDSGSFNDEQASLVAAFPAFITGIEASLAQVDSLHVGVVTTDAYSYNSAGCDVIGGLVTQTGGSYSSNSVCGPYTAGDNFMTELDDLPTAFSCAAQVGTSGSGVERPMDATLAAIGPNQAMPGACNEGFLRDDALLVIVILTDEWDGPNDPEVPGSSGTPMDWYDFVIAAKGGVPEHVVVLSMINYAGGPCPPSSAPYDGVHIADFTQMFGAQGILGGVCEADWSPAFMATQVAIANACEVFGNFP